MFLRNNLCGARRKVGRESDSLENGYQGCQPRLITFYQEQSKVQQEVTCEHCVLFVWLHPVLKVCVV